MDIVSTWGKFRILSVGAGLACVCCILAVAGMNEFVKPSKDKDGKSTDKNPIAGVIMSICGILCSILVLFATMSLSESESATQLIGVGNIGSRLFGLGRN
jgi:hypothetical protein